MPSDSIQPLRISKTPSSSPNKMAPSNRPLSEISVGSTRRNSPSYNQATRKMIVSKDTSPYTENTITKPSTRDFWSSRDPMSPSHLDVENSFSESFRSPSPNGESHSPRRRPSVERLQQASRVKNSKIFELENKAAYDPANVPFVERPAANRPLSENFANNSFTRLDSLRKENNPLRASLQKNNEEKLAKSPTKYSPSMPLTSISNNNSPSPSPTKSSLRSSQFYSDSAIDDSMSFTEDDRSSTPRPILHRHSKSVTFHADPPTITEYETRTPESSILDDLAAEQEGQDEDETDESAEESYEEQDSSFDADLENAEKTPVVLPEHWSGEAHSSLIDDEDDVFESSVIHNPVQEMRRSVSVASDGSSRPLPPLPNGLAKTLRKKESQRLLVNERAESEELVITNLDTGESKELHVRINEAEVHDESVVAELDSFVSAPPRISRESILAKVRGSKYDFDEEDDESEIYESAVDHGRPSYAELALFDPDQPVPSTEDFNDADTIVIQTTEEVVIEEPVAIKTESENELELSAIPSAAEFATSITKSQEKRTSLIRNALAIDSDEEASAYSPASSEETEPAATDMQNAADLGAVQGETLQDAMALLTVKDYSESPKRPAVPDFMSLPSYLGTDDWMSSMKTYCTPSPPSEAVAVAEPEPETATSNAFTSAPVLTPVQSAAEEILPEDTPRHVSDPISDLSEADVPAIEAETEDYDQTHRPVSPIVPERKATIKTGGRLKTRPSGTPADFEALLNEPVDLEENPMPALDFAQSLVSSAEHATANSKLDLSLDIPELQPAATEEDDMLGLEKDFDRVIEGQKKGYLTRQNTKVVVASTRNFSGDGEEAAASQTGRPSSSSGTKSPRKPSAEQHFKAEPWNGKQRRKSLRNASAQANSGPAPPLPGQESALGTVNESSLLDESNLGETERGRLFIKVVGVKDLEMPLPRNDRVDFKLTLDNGLHCVTTAALELNRSAPIGQEFELVVQNDLEFQLTLSTRLPPPPAQVKDESIQAPSSPSKSKSAFSRLLSSPKKRAEKERQEREAQEAAERQRRNDLARKRASQQPNVWDQMRELVSSADGSFARAYVNLGAHENECFGRKLEVAVPLYNEWALEKDASVVSSVRSKRGANCGPIRRPPYVIGQLVCQLLYVPKPKDAADDELPKSMSSAVREISKATEVVEVAHEGFLSQQGGDCVHWRRRFFSVQGAKLTAYHEHTHQKRAVINLTKASRLVDDRRTLMADQSVKSKGRRKSAFAEEDEGYQYVEEGFRIRFANGETIDFYADSRAEKEGWMEALAQVIGKPAQNTRKQRWTDLVLAREKITGQPVPVQSPILQDDTTEVRDFVEPPPPPAKDSFSRKPVSPTKTSPVKSDRYSHAPPPAKRPGTPPLQAKSGAKRRDAVKSMIF